MSDTMNIRGVAVERNGDKIVLLDANDLTTWLRGDHPGLNEAEKSFCRQIADHVDTYAMGVLMASE